MHSTNCIRTIVWSVLLALSCKADASEQERTALGKRIAILEKTEEKLKVSPWTRTDQLQAWAKKEREEVDSLLLKQKNEQSENLRKQQKQLEQGNRSKKLHRDTATSYEDWQAELRTYQVLLWRNERSQ